MVADPDHFALHEAGHAVVQWFVGWDSVLQWIQFRRVDGGVTDGRMKATPPKIDSLAKLRSRLTVLWAGHAAAHVITGQDRSDFDDDFRDMRSAIYQHFHRPLLQTNQFSINFDNDEEANDLIQNSIHNAYDIVRHLPITEAIRRVANELLHAIPDADNLCIVQREKIVEICDKDIGVAGRESNQWSP